MLPSVIKVVGAAAKMAEADLVVASKGQWHSGQTTQHQRYWP